MGDDLKNAYARRLFDGIANSYEGPAQVFSFFQYGRWRRFLLSRLKVTPQALVLDVCTGTGLVAAAMARSIGCRVVGVDLTNRMLEQAQRRLETNALTSRVSLIKGRAESLPFADEAFDSVVFTFLLRYVEDVEATLRELARVVRPGGQMLSLDFFLPENVGLHALWRFHTGIVLPLSSMFLSPGWREVGSFLGPSITAFYQQHSRADLEDTWARVGLSGVRSKALSFGGALAMWGEKRASGGH